MSREMDSAKASGREQGRNYRAAHELTGSVLKGEELLKFAKLQAFTYWLTKGDHNDESVFLLGFLESYKGAVVSFQEEAREPSRGAQPKNAPFDEGIQADYADAAPRERRGWNITRLLFGEETPR